MEHSLRSTRPFPGKNTTSSKYFSDILGLEFEGNNSNISSNQEDVDHEGMEENEQTEYIRKYDIDNSGVQNVDMHDSSNEGIIVSRRNSLDKDKSAEISQPLDLSPMKKGVALDYSSSNQNIIKQNINNSIIFNTSKMENDNFPTNCDASKTVNCQPSTTYPPKITLRLREFASSDIPTKYDNCSLELNGVQYQPFRQQQQQRQTDDSRQLSSPENYTAVSRSLTNTDQKMSTSSSVSSNQGKLREDNPLLNQRPLPTTQISFVKAIQTPIDKFDNVPVSSMAPAWKKARTSSPSSLGHNDRPSVGYEQNRTPFSVTSATTLTVIGNTTVGSNIPTHRTLPPISNLQKPMSLVRKLLPTATSCSISNSSLSSSAGPKLSITAPSTNNIQSGTHDFLVRNQNTDRNHGHIPIASINQNNKVTLPFSNIVPKPGNSDFVRDKLLQLTSQNVRTV